MHVPFIQGRPGTAPRLVERTGERRDFVTDYVIRRKWKERGREERREGERYV